MTLRKLTLVVLCLLFTGMIILNYVLLTIIIHRSITELENKYVNEHMERALKSIDNEVDLLSKTIQDWAPWDDTYHFVKELDEKYITSNLNEASLTNIGINVIVFINDSGKIVYSKGIDLIEHKEMPVPQSMMDYINKSPLLSHIEMDYEINGIIILPEGPMLIALYPILTSNYEGPVRGNLLMGRFLDSAMVKDLSERLTLNLTIQTLEAHSIEYNKVTDAEPIHVQVISNNKIAGYAILKDINNKPVLGLNFEILRDIHRVEQNTLLYLVFALIVIGLVFSVVVLIFLEKNVLSRLSFLSRELKYIGEEAMPSYRLKPGTRNDELVVVSKEINVMLDKLDASKKTIQESEVKFRTFVEKANDVIFALDKNRRITYISPNCVNILGHLSSEILGETFDNFIYPEDLNKWLGVFNNLSEVIGYNHELEYRMQNKNGNLLWCRTDFSMLAGASNSETFFIGILYDISEHKKYEESLQKAHGELEARVYERTLELAKANEDLRVEIIERIKVQDKIRHLAFHDHLTGLPNRLLFIDRLDQAILQANRAGKLVVVMLLDLDDFKRVNDTMGHAQGDELLKIVALRLKNTLRKSDTIARIGGDEFQIIFQNLADDISIESIAKKICESFIKPFICGEQKHFITTSIGISVFPTDGEDSSTLMKNADIAMYKAKEKGKNKYELCSLSMKTKVIETMKLTNDLYHALERNQLLLHYQPQLSCNTNKVVGLEALLRWQHPELGLVSPATFIPIAEQTGLIIPIGEWVLRTACKQNKKWQDAGLPPVRIAVNISMYQILNPNIVEQVSRILNNTKLNSKYLELEITESIVLKETEYVLDVLRSFKKLGITIAIDDFGTEYSSLQYLKQLPVDRIKIAMTFVHGISLSDKDEAITKAIVILAQNLGLNTIAEGVETKEQLDFLTQNMCNEIQGFFYYKPMPVHEVEELLRKDTIV